MIDNYSLSGISVANIMHAASAESKTSSDAFISDNLKNAAAAVVTTDAVSLVNNELSVVPSCARLCLSAQSYYLPTSVMTDTLVAFCNMPIKVDKNVLAQCVRADSECSQSFADIYSAFVNLGSLCAPFYIPSSSSSSSPPLSPPAVPNPNNNGNASTFISSKIAIGVGASGGLLLLIALVIAICACRKRKLREGEKEKPHTEDLERVSTSAMAEIPDKTADGFGKKKTEEDCAFKNDSNHEAASSSSPTVTVPSVRRTPSAFVVANKAEEPSSLFVPFEKTHPTTWKPMDVAVWAKKQSLDQSIYDALYAANVDGATLFDLNSYRVALLGVPDNLDSISLLRAVAKLRKTWGAKELALEPCAATLPPYSEGGLNSTSRWPPVANTKMQAFAAGDGPPPNISIPTIPPPSYRDPSLSSRSTYYSSSTSDNSSSGIGVAIVIGIIVGILVLICIIVGVVRCWKKSTVKPRAAPAFVPVQMARPAPVLETPVVVNVTSSVATVQPVNVQAANVQTANVQPADVQPVNVQPTNAPMASRDLESGFAVSTKGDEPSYLFGGSAAGDTHPAMWSRSEVIVWARNRDIDQRVINALYAHNIDGAALFDMNAYRLTLIGIPHSSASFVLLHEVGRLRERWATTENASNANALPRYSECDDEDDGSGPYAFSESKEKDRMWRITRKKRG
ncbi:hypothetical protein HDU97_007866 [Phlyctochytrium planicorne]|nr:hypothetical protein HDU97_007866 [Phlyctochytrium planicorne]